LNTYPWCPLQTWNALIGGPLKQDLSSPLIKFFRAEIQSSVRVVPDRLNLGIGLWLLRRRLNLYVVVGLVKGNISPGADMFRGCMFAPGCRNRSGY
jgi:hypothetical protein